MDRDNGGEGIYAIYLGSDLVALCSEEEIIVEEEIYRLCGECLKLYGLESIDTKEIIVKHLRKTFHILSSKYSDLKRNAVAIQICIIFMTNRHVYIKKLDKKLYRVSKKGETTYYEEL